MVVAAVQAGRLAELKAEAARAARFLRQVELGDRRLGVAVLDDAVIVWSEPAGCELPSLPGPVRIISGSGDPVPTFDIATYARALASGSDYLPPLAQRPARFISGSDFIPIFFTAEDIASYLCAPKVMAARRGMSEDDVVRLLSYDPQAARAIKELAGDVEVLLARHEGEMREAGYGDAADLLRTLVAAASILA